MPAIEIVEGGRILDSFSSEWDHLSHESPHASPFQSRQWMSHWLNHFSDPSRLKTIVVREGADIVALFPLIKHASPWMALRSVGTGPSDYLGPLQLNENNQIGAAVHEAIKDLAKKHLVDLHQIPSDHPFSREFADSEVIQQARCLILDLPNSFSEYLSSLSKSLRYDVRRLEGKALKERNAVVDWGNADNAAEFADQFFHALARFTRTTSTTALAKVVKGHRRQCRMRSLLYRG